MKQFSGLGLAVIFFFCFPLIAGAAEKWEWQWDHREQRVVVGKMARFSGNILENGKQPDEPLEIVITAFSKESGAPIFRAKSPVEKGEFQFYFQFYDGSPHLVRLEAFRAESRTPLSTVETEVEVTAVSPPGAVQVKALAFLLLITFAGMMAGVGWVLFRERKAAKRGNSDVLPSAT
ncbi:hypothetical protein [Lihuaxuella thermophila]|uniref:YtkA-like n=1 Tax=Lihuaxuella thermophila TaxID=1173111 RepID=A0A1H8E1N1_9BACL|nr:hypothetical protein [Lihuaxuella thermophila]SEN12688.1 hypothetical protein SAMN05444955_10659 [Lihuaxuella thermophila]